ncbi:MAG: TonB-dependent receptor [candidate division Zixibacteria bacterium]|nr:TonB-dependent receptor [candidate division Zixibacteria bacterium]
MFSKPIEMGTIVVVAERPLVIKDRTASLRVVEADRIGALPTRGYRDLLALQPGVVMRTGDQLNVRGGRTSEVAYYVDGFSQQDPLTGVSTTQINSNDLEEISITTGGFNAEYGWVASGAINVTTKEGGDRLAGTAEAITDNFHGSNYDYNLYDLSLSGPLSPITNNVKFIVSGERRWQGDRTPSAIAGGPLPDNGSSGWTWRGKLSMKLSRATDLRLGGMTSTDQWKLWRNSWKFDMNHAPRLADNNHSINATLQHVISPMTFFTVAGSYFSTERTRGDGVYFDNIWGYGRPGGSYGFDQEGLFQSWDDINGPTAVEDTTIDGRTYVLRGDESAIWNNYLHRQSSYVGFKFDLVSQANRFHELRVGGEFQRHTLRRYQHLLPSNVYQGLELGFQDVDRYGYNITGDKLENSGLQGAKHPVTFATYLQDKLELSGLVVNAGLRLDYLNVNTVRLRDESDPLDPDHYLKLEHPTDEQRELAGKLDPGDLQKSWPEVELSPRLGIAFPVTDQSVFHVSYGRFMQRPDLQNLYVSYDYLEYKILTGGYFFPFGNPNLRPERTTAYEIGWTRQLGPNSSFNLTTYYKDVAHLTQVVNQPAHPNSFATYRNTDFGTIKGLEATFELRRTHNIGVEASYSLSRSTGTGSTPNSQSDLVWQGGEAPKTANPLDFDQRHKLTAILDLRADNHEGPALGGWHFLENAGLNVTWTAGSGFPYTPTKMYNAVALTSVRADNTGPVNSRTGPWTMQMDLKATKTFAWGGSRIEFQLWILNLFNRKNVVNVYQTTGLPNSTGWSETAGGDEFLSSYDRSHDSSGLTGWEKYSLRENDPLNYGPPRQIRAGIKVSF